jgi:uncharacterized protein (TIGR02145 family)
MSKSTFVFLLAVVLSFSQSMASGISLQFEARYACGHTPIDSILVENLSRQTSVVLYYPDTVIDSAPVSVVTLPGNGNTMHVSQNYPNPFTGRTSVDVFVPRSDWVTLRVFDISGRLLASHESQLEPGMHHFEFHSSDRQHYLLSVSSNRFHEQRLMIQLGRGSRQQPELVYAGMGAQMMSGQDAEFYFQPGDDMRYTAYVTAPGGEVVHDTKEDTPAGSTVYLFEMAEEVPARPSEIQGPAMVSAQATGLEYEVDHVPGVHYEWTLPQGWEIISGAGQSLITVNAGNQSGTLTVVASNDCGSSAERTFDVEMEYLLTLDVDPAETGTAAGAGEYVAGQPVSVSASPAPGFEFVAWKDAQDAVVSTQAGYTFDMPAENLHLTARFQTLSFNLTLAVNSDFEGQASGEGTFAFNESVTITATPEPGFSFLYWEDDAGTHVSTDTQYTFNMPAEDVTLTAFFGVVDADGNTYSYTTINGRQWLSQNLRTTRYADGSDIPDLVENAAWSGTTQGAYGVVPHDMITGIDSGAQMADAFGKLYNHYAVTDSRGLCPAGWSVPAAADFQGLFDYLGDEYGYLPGMVDVNDPYKSIPYALRSCRQVNSPLGGDCDTQEQPRWPLDPYTYGGDPFGFRAFPGGLRNVDGSYYIEPFKSYPQLQDHAWHSKNEGELSIGFWWSATPGYHMVLANFIGEFVYTENTMYTPGMSVRCIRDKDFYSLVLSHDPEAGGIVSGGGDFAQGQQVSVEAVPNSGFAFIHWLDAFGEVVSTEAAWTFEMPNHDLNLTAIFEAVISAVTVETASAFEGSVSGGGEYMMGEDVTITATPEPGFSLLYWEDETGAQVSTDAQYTFTMPAEDVSLTAFFGVVDAGGNTYSYTTINGRQWFSENLRTPVYNDGTPIARPQDAGEWSAATTGAYAVLPHGYLQGLNSDADVVAAYGKLYNYRVVQDDRGVCPAGWSIASHYNYLGLFEYLELEYGLTLDGYFLKDDAPGHSKNAGHALSSCRQVNSPLGGDCTTTEHPRWSPFVDDVYGWDQFGFAALPAGFRDNDGYFISAPLKKGDQLAKMSPAKDYFDENYMDIAGFWAAGKVTLVGFSSFVSFFDHYPEDDYWFDAALASGAALRCIRDKGTYSVQLTSEPLDGGVLAGAGDYALGQQVSIMAEAAPGFAFTHWQNGLGHVVSTEASWSFEMPNHDLNLTAVFEAAISNTVSVATAAAIEGSVSGGGEYMMGEDVTVTATPESGFTFLYWEDDAGTQVSTEAQYTFSMPAEDLTLTAIFGVVDADGNTYGYTTINGRQWLSENLRTTKYADGSSIPYLVKDTDWEETTGGAYAVMPHDMVIGLDSGTQVVDAFGKLYNHHAVADSRGLCPAGWSVPPAADYQSLFDYLINVHGYLPGFVYDPYKAQYLPNALRSCRQLGSPLGDDCNTGVQPRWFEDPNSYSSDPFGWSGLPGGVRDYDGRFMTTLAKSSLQNHEFAAHAPKTNEIIISLFWTANPEAFLLLSSFWAELFTDEDVDELMLSVGMSLRCIRNNP